MGDRAQESTPRHRVFYCPDASRARVGDIEDPARRTVVLSPDESHHALRVLRLKAGDAVRLFDGEGFFYEGRIARQGRGGVEVEIESFARSAVEPQRRVGLVLGVLKGRKIDLLVQKSVELGAAEILVFPARRSVARREPATAKDETPGRLDRIVVSACKQCGRATLMPVRRFATLEDALRAVLARAARYVFWERMAGGPQARETALSVPDEGAYALIGPEGGFAREEIDAVLAAGFEPRSLGPRILRAETAALAAVSLLLYSAGELS